MAAKSFFWTALPAAANCATAPVLVALDAWPPGIGVDLSIQDQNIDILSRGQHMVNPAIADVIGPTVAAKGPDDFWPNMSRMLYRACNSSWFPVPAEMAFASAAASACPVVREPSVSLRWFSHFWAHRVHSGGVSSFWARDRARSAAAVCPGVHRQVHAIAKLRTVFKERVFPKPVLSPSLLTV